MFVEGNAYFTESGLEDGKKVISEKKEVFGKNTGKKNETSDQEQAISEAESQVRKKLKTKYYRTKESAKNAEGFFKVMLADKWESRKEKLEYPAIVQPKLDGIRCVITKDGARTRGNTPINVIPHILNELQPFFELYPNVILDGELYNHDLKDDFQKLISVVRKDKTTPENLAESKKYMQYHIYDCPIIGDLNESADYTQRIDTLYGSIINKAEYIKLIVGFPALEECDVDRFHSDFLSQGYEGSIVRVNGPYENKRSKGLLKRKDFIDEEAKVIKIEEGKGNWAGYAKVFTLELNGKQFHSGVRGSQEYLKEVLENKQDYIEKSATLRYFRLTDDDIPYLPVIVNLSREDYE